MMKRYFMLICTLALAFSQAACGSGGKDQPADPAGLQAPADAASQGPEEPADAASQGPEGSADADSLQEDDRMQNIQIKVGDKTFPATLCDNEAAREFAARLPMTLSMSEMNGNEKYNYLPDSLPADPSLPSGIRAGDLMLYGSDCLVLFYESFSTSYRYTPLGAIDDPAGLYEALGGGSAQVSFAAAP